MEEQELKIPYLWIKLNPKFSAEDFIDALHVLCKQYSLNDNFYFRFDVEE